MKMLLDYIGRRVAGYLRSLYWKSVYEGYRDRYSIGRDFRFNGVDVIFYGDGSIVVGQGSYIGGLSTVYAANGYKVVVGSGCSISHNVRIYTASPIADSDFSIESPPSKYGDVLIGNYSWIGANVFINPGVVIGENAVIGANSVVTRNVAPGEIWGGVPARLIRKKQGGVDAA